MKKLLLFSILITFGFINVSTTNSYVITDSHAKCTGSKYCNACKNCKYCKHCNEGRGKCGVCR